MPTEEEKIISRLRGEVPSNPPTTPKEPSDSHQMPAAAPGAAFQSLRAPGALSVAPGDAISTALDRLEAIEVRLAHHTGRAYLEPLNAGWASYTATNDPRLFLKALDRLEALLVLVQKADRMIPVLVDRKHPKVGLIVAGLAAGALADREARKVWEVAVEQAWRGYLAVAGPVAGEIEKEWA